MKRYSMLFTLLIIFTGIAHAAENTKAEVASIPSPQNKIQYLIELAEFRLEQALPIGLSEREIIAMIHQSKATPVETVRAVVVADTQCVVDSGRRVSVTTGKITTNGHTSRNTDYVEIGTVLNVTIAPHANGAMADVDYSTSRLDDNETDDSPPDVLTNSTQLSQIYVLGEQRLLAIIGGENLTCVLISVSELP